MLESGSPSQSFTGSTRTLPYTREKTAPSWSQTLLLLVLARTVSNHLATSGDGVFSWTRKPTGGGWWSGQARARCSPLERRDGTSGHSLLRFDGRRERRRAAVSSTPRLSRCWSPHSP